MICVYVGGARLARLRLLGIVPATVTHVVVAKYSQSDLFVDIPCEWRHY